MLQLYFPSDSPLETRHEMMNRKNVTDVTANDFPFGSSQISSPFDVCCSDLLSTIATLMLNQWCNCDCSVNEQVQLTINWSSNQTESSTNNCFECDLKDFQSIITQITPHSTPNSTKRRAYGWCWIITTNWEHSECKWIFRFLCVAIYKWKED